MAAQPSFDPDAYLASKSSAPAFDPDAYLASKGPNHDTTKQAEFEVGMGQQRREDLEREAKFGKVEASPTIGGELSAGRFAHAAGLAYENVRRHFSGLLGPTESERIEGSVPMHDAQGNVTWQYKPAGNRLEQESGLFTPFLKVEPMQPDPSDSKLKATGKALFNIASGIEGSILSPGGLATSGGIVGGKSVVGQVISRATSGAFSADMIKGAKDQLVSGHEAKTFQGKLQGYLGGAVSLIMAALGIAHAGTPTKAQIVEHINAVPDELLHEAASPKNSDKEIANAAKKALTDRAAQLSSEVEPVLPRLPGDTQAKVRDIIEKQSSGKELSQNEQATLTQVRSYAAQVREDETPSGFTSRSAPPPTWKPTEATPTGGGTSGGPQSEGIRSVLSDQLDKANAPLTAETTRTELPKLEGGEKPNELPSQPEARAVREGGRESPDENRLPVEEGDSGAAARRQEQERGGGEPEQPAREHVTETTPKGGETLEREKDQAAHEDEAAQQRGELQDGQGDGAKEVATEGVQPSSKILGPALRHNGEVVARGEVGQLHKDLVPEAKSKLSEDELVDVLANAKPGSTGFEHIFHDEKGNTLTREYAAQRALETGQITQEQFDNAMARAKDRGLHSEDLIAGKEQQDKRVDKIVQSDLASLKEAQDPEEMMEHLEGIENEGVTRGIAKSLGIETEGKSVNDLNGEIVDKAMEQKDAAPRETEEPQPQDFEPEPEDYGAPKAKLYGGGTMTKRLPPLGITPKMPAFFEHITDILAGVSNLPEFANAANAFKGWLGALAGRTFPRLTVLNRELGEAGARWISSRIAAKPAALIFSTKVLEGLDVDPKAFGAALTEDNLRSVRNGFEKQAEALRDKGDEDGAAKMQKEADGVQTVIGAKGSPFKTEGEYQSFLQKPETKAAIDRHKAMWDAAIGPMYKQAMSLDPDVELPPRGLQTGARVNLNAIMEGEKQGDTVYTVGTGNLLGTMRRKSVFGREATGAAQAYGTNYHDIIANTYGKQLEVANKNAFEDALVEKGFAKIDKPGQEVEINGKKAMSFPYKRQSAMIIREGEKTPVAQSKNIYIDPRFAKEYESGANVLRFGSGTNILRGLTNIFNRAALTGLTDATVHISNQSTALFTRPALSAPLLADTMLSLFGRADVLVTLSRALMKGFGKRLELHSEQIKELAEIGAMREDHKGDWHPWNPIGWPGRLINWADKTSRLSLDDAYKRMADAGLVEKSETNRREFVNQVGQYNKRAQGAFMRWMRDSGVAPFATAGKTFNALAIRTATLDPGVKAASMPAAMALRANQIAKWMGAAGLIATANYLITKKVTGRPGVPLGSIDTGKDDKNGRPLSIPAMNILGFGRALRITGVRGAAEASHLGLGPKDAADAAARDIITTGEGPWLGPAVRFAATAMNIPTGPGLPKPVPAVAPGESQMAANVKQAAIQASPLVASVADRFKTGGSVMESLQRQLPRYLPQSGKPPEMVAKYPQIVRTAQARSFTNDVIGQARKMEPEARREFIEDALRRLDPSDRPQFLRTLRYSHINY